MLTISAEQYDCIAQAFEEARRREIRETILARHAALFAEDRGLIDRQIDELQAAGFQRRVDIISALGLIVETGLRRDGAATEARALLGRILANQAAPPGARLAFARSALKVV